MKNKDEQIIEIFLPKPEEPESIATLLPSYLLRRELVTSSTLEMESTFPFLPKSGTLEGWGQIALSD
jgi:hypothetical protein